VFNKLDRKKQQEGFNSLNNGTRNWFANSLNKGKLLFATAMILGFFAFSFHWTANRIYVPEGQSLMLRYKGPLLFGKRTQAKKGHFANEGEIGVRSKLRGPGRHFYCPVWWERTIVDDQIVLPGQVAIVRSMLGEELPVGQYLVDGKLGETNHKGILRNAYGPGRYRANPYAYEFQVVGLVEQKVGQQIKHSGWVNIPTGYVGVVTNLTNIPQKNQLAGIQPDVLPPGIYPINTKEQQIDIVEIGYRETTLQTKLQRNRDGELVLDEAGEPMTANNVKDSGINFPSNDGFPIHMDFTSIWGIMPVQAPQVIRTFGNVQAVENKVVIPQTESICRNHGSQYSAVELLVGEDRQKFQLETADAFERILNEKNLTMLYGLVRHIYISRSVRVPIQNKFIADELKLTRDQEQLTAKEEALFREAEKQVGLESERVASETRKLIAERLAEGRKSVGETNGETTKLVASVDRQVADLQAQARVVKGEAEAKAEQLQREAHAQKFQLAVEAFGSGQAYNQWVFAENLPENVELKLLYAGEGTFWTDLEGTTHKLIGKQLDDERQQRRK
jgi:hypothetical protein